MPEKKLIVLLSQPESIGVAVPDEMDLQVSLTPSFDPGDIVKDYQDYASPTLLLDDAVDFTTAPSPLYMRARQKDSVRSIVSQWSSAPTVWLQRAFRDLVIGREVFVEGNNSFVRWIDKTGNPVSVAPGYWNDHPIWGGMVPVKWESPDGNPTLHDMVRLPAFYMDAETVEDDEDGLSRYRYWISPVAFEGERGYLHPAFRNSMFGLLVGAALSTISTYLASLYDVNAGGNTFANWQSYLNTMRGSDLKIDFYNVHVKNALYHLAFTEYCTNSLTGVTSGGGVANSSANANYRNIRCLGNHATGADTAREYLLGVRFYRENGGSPHEIYLGLGSSDTTFLVGTYPQDGNVTGNPAYTKSILTGFNEILGAHLELYGLPKSHGNAANADKRWGTYTRDYAGTSYDYRNIVDTQFGSDIGLGLSVGYYTLALSRFIVLD
jgi:hypothetical protein